MFTEQSLYDIRFEWGLRGVEALAPNCDSVIIIDVLSFSTSVDIATSNQALVYPHASTEESAEDFARRQGAILAGHPHQQTEGFSLRPSSLLDILPKTKLVLPSPNGLTLTVHAAKVAQTYAACLRNCRTVAEAAMTQGQTVAVIACGERWPDHSLRPGLEDLLGAGAVIHYLQGHKSPEAQIAEQVFVSSRDRLPEILRACASGVELIERGFAADVELAAALNVSRAVPMLVEGCYVNVNRAFSFPKSHYPNP